MGRVSNKGSHSSVGGRGGRWTLRFLTRPKDRDGRLYGVHRVYGPASAVKTLPFFSSLPPAD